MEDNQSTAAAMNYNTELLDLLRENRVALQASIDMQQETMRYLRGLNDWMDRDAHDRQNEFRSIAVRLDTLREDVLKTNTRVDRLGEDIGIVDAENTGPDVRDVLPENGGVEKDFMEFAGHVYGLATQINFFEEGIKSLGASAEAVRVSRQFRYYLSDVLHFQFTTLLRSAPGAFRTDSISYYLSHIQVETAEDSMLVEGVPGAEDSLIKLSQSVQSFYRVLADFGRAYHDAKLLSVLLRLARILEQQYLMPDEGGGPAKDTAQLLPVLTAHFRFTSAALSQFNEKGIAAIRSSQKSTVNKYLNMSQVAAFLAGVTATALQYENKGGGLGTATNSVWFFSLVSGVGSTLSSLLGVMLTQTNARPHDRKLPVLISKTLAYGPMVTLALAGLTFLLGLCLFTFASSQARVTALIASVSSGAVFVCLLIVSTWFIVEKFLFAGYKENDWLRDYLQRKLRPAQDKHSNARRSNPGPGRGPSPIPAHPPSANSSLKELGLGGETAEREGGAYGGADTEDELGPARRIGQPIIERQITPPMRNLVTSDASFSVRGNHSHSVLMSSRSVITAKDPVGRASSQTAIGGASLTPERPQSGQVQEAQSTFNTPPKPSPEQPRDWRRPHPYASTNDVNSSRSNLSTRSGTTGRGTPFVDADAGEPWTSARSDTPRSQSRSRSRHGGSPDLTGSAV